MESKLPNASRKFWQIMHTAETKEFRDPISVEIQATSALYYLTDTGRMQKVANSFGIVKSTISKIIRRVLFLL